MKIAQTLEAIVEDPEIMLEGMDVSLIEDLYNVLHGYLLDYDATEKDEDYGYLEDLDTDPE